MSAGAPEVVIATKLFRPSPRHPPVGRKRLHDLLRGGTSLPLTLVAAPAGWGKSTLVADWLGQDAPAAGWVSLDDGDNDPKRFWRYLLLSAAEAGAPAGRAALRQLDAAGSSVPRDVLPAFINELATGGPLVCVLDDYHLIVNREVHTSVATLLDRCPPQLHLVLITRADPPLPLSRLRVRGELAELRAEHLRFTFDEAAEFFTGRLETPLTARDVQRLLARTEGWAAGLQLAALRLADRADPEAFIDRFTGADWHIVSYLGEEVLASQPPPVQEFLLATSILNRMCAPLANALTGRDDGEELLNEINRANLFLIPLDEERRWFRYHHLFGGLLKHELARTAPGKVPLLHRRAAHWYAAHGEPAEAIGHAAASGDHTLTGRLVAAHWRGPLNAGQLETVRGWLAALPAQLVAGDESLSAARVWVALDTGRLEEVAAALDAAEASGQHGTHLSVLRALWLYKTGDVGGAARQLSGTSVPGDDPFVATVHRLVGGISAMWLGDPGRARELLAEAARRAEDNGNRLACIYAQGCRALMAAERGDLSLAALLAAGAETVVQETLSGGYFVAMFPRLALARLRAREGNWAAACEAGQAAAELARRGAGRVELAAALLAAAAAVRACPPAAGSGPEPGGTGAAGPAGGRDANGSEATAPSSDPAALVREARGILRHCPDPGPVVSAWLAGEERAESVRSRLHAMIEPLTDRELAILRLLPAPTPQRELASALFVTPNTLKTHLRAIYRKLGAESRDDAVIRARDRGLI